MREDDLDRPATRRDLLELRRHFDVVSESFRSEFRNLFDWARSTTDTLGRRVDGLEDNHEHRLTALELRMTNAESRKRG